MPNYLIVGGSDRHQIDALACDFVVAVRHTLSIDGAELKSGDTGNIWTREQLRIVVGGEIPEPVKAKPGKRGRR